MIANVSRYGLIRIGIPWHIQYQEGDLLTLWSLLPHGILDWWGWDLHLMLGGPPQLGDLACAKYKLYNQQVESAPRHHEENTLDIE